MPFFVLWNTAVARSTGSPESPGDQTKWLVFRMTPNQPGTVWSKSLDLNLHRGPDMRCECFKPQKLIIPCFGGTDLTHPTNKTKQQCSKWISLLHPDGPDILHPKETMWKTFHLTPMFEQFSTGASTTYLSGTFPYASTLGPSESFGPSKNFSRCSHLAPPKFNGWNLKNDGFQVRFISFSTGRTQFSSSMLNFKGVNSTHGFFGGKMDLQKTHPFLLIDLESPVSRWALSRLRMLIV